MGRGFPLVSEERFAHIDPLTLCALWLAHAFRNAAYQHANICDQGGASMSSSRSLPDLLQLATVRDGLIFEHSAECSFIRIEAVADFEIHRGQAIKVWPAIGAMQKEIEIFLFGPVWATLCHQRGLLPLHASAIATEGGIIAFAGPSGAGKSTTAALMGAFDYKLFADDILPVNFGQNSNTRRLAISPSLKAARRLDYPATGPNCD